MKNKILKQFLSLSLLTLACAFAFTGSILWLTDTGYQREFAWNHGGIRQHFQYDRI